jgi:hypothetical protein
MNRKCLTWRWKEKTNLKECTLLEYLTLRYCSTPQKRVRNREKTEKERMDIEM